MSRPCQRDRRSPKSGQLSSVGGGLQHPDERLERDERVLLVLDARRDVETRQERPRVTTEFPHQIAVPPQVGGTDQAGHSITPHVSGNDKSMSETVKTRDGALDHSVSTTSCDTAGKSARIAMNAHHFDVLIIGAGLSGIGTACQLQAELPHKTIARAGAARAASAAPGTCSATPASVRTPTCTPSATSSARGWTLKVLADGPSIRSTSPTPPPSSASTRRSTTA